MKTKSHNNNQGPCLTIFFNQLSLYDTAIGRLHVFGRHFSPHLLHALLVDGARFRRLYCRRGLANFAALLPGAAHPLETLRACR